MTQAELDDLSADMLRFLASDPIRFERFLAVTGLAVGDLRSLAEAHGLAESLLDYLSADERLLRTFAVETGREPAALATVRLRLAPPPFEP
jgi:hypothetical protein